MRLIDADELEREGWSLHRTFQKDARTMVYETKKPSDFPTIESERETGEWIEIQYRVLGGHKFIKSQRCSKCGKIKDKYVTWNFCPNCGKDMRKRKNNVCK